MTYIPALLGLVDVGEDVQVTDTDVRHSRLIEYFTLIAKVNLNETHN